LVVLIEEFLMVSEQRAVPVTLDIEQVSGPEDVKLVTAE
jgi:hypothetical protein